MSDNNNEKNNQDVIHGLFSIGNAVKNIPVPSDYPLHSSDKQSEQDETENDTPNPTKK